MKTILVLAAMCLSFSANAYTAKCLLQVEGTTYINGDCNFSPFNDGTGSFSLGTDDPTTRFFAYVFVNEDGTANAAWNGADGASHAHNDLGELKRNGACRFNDRAIICAWAK